MAAIDNTIVQTGTSALVALLGSGGLGAIILWWVNNRGQKGSSFLQAQKDVYEAFEELAKSQQARIDQLVKQISGSQEDRAKLWEQMWIEKEHSRKQDKALVDCELKTTKQDEMIENLGKRIHQLERDIRRVRAKDSLPPNSMGSPN